MTTETRIWDGAAWRLINGPVGATGSPGTNGTNGSPGVPGRSVVVTTSAIPPVAPVAGDQWINGALVQVWSGAAWVSLVGAIGATGATGPQGNPGITGADATVRWGAVNMNLVGDTAVIVPFAKWRPLELTAYSPSIDLSTVARFGLYTAPGGGGTALIVPVVLSLALDGDDVFTIQAAPKRTIQTASSIYLRCTTPKGVPATCRFSLTIRDLTT